VKTELKRQDCDNQSVALDCLDTIAFDWSDFDRAGHESRAFLRNLSQDRPALRKLVYEIELRPDLLAMCERHQLLDYLVLQSSDERGFRLRMHVSTDDHFDRPHDHRFSFSSYILKGKYSHTLHEVRRGFYDEARNDEARAFDSRFNLDMSEELLSQDIGPVHSRDEVEGNCYSLHHSQVHTTFTTPDTVSLFLRGPSEKRRSIIFDRDTGRYWWRYGMQEESPERRMSKAMTIEYYMQLRSRLERLGII
jgi:hypothetical protein